MRLVFAVVPFAFVRWGVIFPFRGTSNRRLAIAQVADMESEEAAILLVEDDELVREIVNEVLIADGLRVTMAATGSDGLNRIKDTEFDLVVTGIALPGGLDGVQMARALRPGLRCVFLSSGQPPSDLRALQQIYPAGDLRSKHAKRPSRRSERGTCPDPVSVATEAASAARHQIERPIHLSVTGDPLPSDVTPKFDVLGAPSSPGSGAPRRRSMPGRCSRAA